MLNQIVTFWRSPPNFTFCSPFSDTFFRSFSGFRGTFSCFPPVVSRSVPPGGGKGPVRPGAPRVNEFLERSRTSEEYVIPFLFVPCPPGGAAPQGSPLPEFPVPFDASRPAGSLETPPKLSVRALSFTASGEDITKRTFHVGIIADEKMEGPRKAERIRTHCGSDCFHHQRL